MCNLEKRCNDCGSTAVEDWWTLELNQYQRDNLLWLLRLVSCPRVMKGPVDSVEPFTFANTGDWLSEIAAMLSDEKGDMIPGEYTNETSENIRRMVNQWRGPGSPVA